MNVYRVRNWAKHFENSETRKLKRLYWVPLPCKQDGDGYTELMDHPNGAAHFGAWTALVQVAAKCDPRGTLLRFPGIPHDAGTISRITRIPPGIFREAIPRLLKIRWLEEIPISPDVPGDAPEISGDAPEKSGSADPDLTCPDLNRPDLNNPEQTCPEQQLTAPGAAVSKPPARKPEPMAYKDVDKCVATLGLTYFGSLTVSQQALTEAIPRIGMDLAFAWLLSADEDRRAGKIKTNPLQYYRGLIKKGEPDDKWLREAKRQLRPHVPPAKDTGPQPLAEIVKGAPHA